MRKKGALEESPLSSSGVIGEEAGLQRVDREKRLDLTSGRRDAGGS
jgi:hypothetical protein